MDSDESPPESAPSDASSTSSAVATDAADNNTPAARLPPIFPHLPRRPSSLSSIPALAGLSDPSQAFKASDPLDPGLRRLLLLQTLAAQQQQILEALGHDPGGGLHAHLSALAPTPPGTPQVLGSSPAASSHDQFQHPPPAAEAYHRQQEAQWASVIDGLNIVPAQSPPFVNGAAGRRSSVASASSTSTGVIDARELEQAQAQLDAWSQIAFTSTTHPSVPAGLPFSSPPTSSFSPPAFDWSAALYPPTTVSPASTSMSAENSASPPTSRTRAASVSKKAKPKVDQEDREEFEEEEVEEDKRKRNTAASARFRAKKKQRDAELQQTSAQLRERLADLEKQASSLKAENQWLRDLISERTEPRLHNKV